jgi:hypothetical protein
MKRILLIFILNLAISILLQAQNELIAEKPKTNYPNYTFIQTEALTAEDVTIISKRLQVQYAISVNFECISKSIIGVDLTNQLIPVSGKNICDVVNKVKGNDKAKTLKDLTLESAKDSCH